MPLELYPVPFVYSSVTQVTSVVIIRRAANIIESITAHTVFQFSQYRVIA